MRHWRAKLVSTVAPPYFVRPICLGDLDSGQFCYHQDDFEHQKPARLGRLGKGEPKHEELVAVRYQCGVALGWI